MSETALLSDITPDPNQPRKHFDEEKLQELANSIKTEGLLQPITVVPYFPALGEQIHVTQPKYKIVAGERRWRASMLAGETEIEINVLEDRDETDVATLALVENLQREDLSLSEIAAGVAVLVEKVGVSEAGKRLGKSKAWVSLRAGVKGMPKPLARLIEIGKIADIQIAQQLDQLSSLDHTLYEQTLHTIEFPETWDQPITREVLANDIRDAKAEIKRREEEEADRALQIEKAQREGKPAPAEVRPNESNYEREQRLRKEKWAEIDPLIRRAASAERKAIVAVLGKVAKEFSISIGKPPNGNYGEPPKKVNAADFHIELRGNTKDLGRVMDAAAPKEKLGHHVSANIEQWRQIEAILNHEFSFTQYLTVKGKKLAEIAPAIVSARLETILPKKPAQVSPEKLAVDITLQDALNLFVKERVQQKPGDWVRVKDFHLAYVVWSDKNQHSAESLTSPNWAKLAEKAGLVCHRLKTGRVYLDIALKGAKS